MVPSANVSQDSRSGQRSREAAIKSASRMAKWKEQIEDVRQKAIVSIDAPSDRTTRFAIQE